MVLTLALLVASGPLRRDAVDWNEAVAALQLVSEEYVETLEIDDPVAKRQRSEQLATFLGRAAARIPRGQIHATVNDIRARLTHLDYTVSDRCRAAIRAILERAPVRRTPRTKPDLERGKSVYLQACAPCHAADGSGKNAPAAMDPPPPDILHPRKNWTPYEMFNRVTYGGAETAMPSFKEGLPESSRWDVVFYLFAERWPPCAAPMPPMRADELALLGDYELSNMFPYGAAACLRRGFLPPAKDAPRTR